MDDTSTRNHFWPCLIVVLSVFIGSFAFWPTGRNSQPHVAVAAIPAHSPVLPTGTLPPIDDVRVNDCDNSRPGTNESLQVSGENVYDVYGGCGNGPRLARSADGGHSFLPGVELPGFGMSPAVARREGAGVGDTNLYVTFVSQWWLWFTHSTDGGATWLPAQIVRNSEPDQTSITIPKIIVDLQGVIYLAWSEQILNGDGEGYFYTMHSSDDGATWSDPIPINSELTVTPCEQCITIADHNGAIYFAWEHRPSAAPYEQILFARSTDGGQNWSEPTRIDDGGEARKTTVDLAVAEDGTIYASWSDDRIFHGWYILPYIARSTDDGVTWGPGVLAYDAGSCVQHSYPSAIVVDKQTASVHLVLQDGRNYCDAPFYMGWDDIFYTYSTDYGTSWSSNEQISDPIPFNVTCFAAGQSWNGIIYTTWYGADMTPTIGPQTWLDVHDPHLPTVTPTTTGTSTPTPSPTASPTVSATPTPSPTSSPNFTPTPTASSTPLPTLPANRVLLPRVDKSSARKTGGLGGNLNVWQDRQKGAASLYGQLVSPCSVGSCAAFLIARTADIQGAPITIAGEGSFQDFSYLVVWTDHRADAWDVYGQVISAQGALIGPLIPVIHQAGGSLHATGLVYDRIDSRYLVVWKSDSDIYGRWLGLDGSRLTPSFRIAGRVDTQVVLAAIQTMAPTRFQIQSAMDP